MKKFRVGVSLILLVAICLVFKNFLLLLNYFFALILHELAHLFVATARGYKLKQLRLDMFGLSLSLDEKIADKDAFAINIAGPLFNLVLCVICVACYWLVPESYYYLNLFCISNICLAIFNLLPIYPLDGGKIFRSIFKNEKSYLKVDRMLRVALCLIFIALFVLSFFKTINFFYALMAMFLLSSKPNKQPTITIFKTAKEKDFAKIVLIKVNENNTIFDLLKRIKSAHYTIFYCNTTKTHYLDEDMLINFSLTHPLDSKLINII